MNGIGQDVKFAARMLAKAPWFTLVAVLTLALGLGANTAIFAVVNAFILRPLPVDKPGELVAIFTSDYSSPTIGSSSFPDYQDFRDRTTVFSGLAAYTQQPASLSTSGPSQTVAIEFVSANYFDVLGVQPELGRGFRAEEGQTPGTHPVVVLSRKLWQRQFASDPAIIGRSIALNGHDFTIVGVAPERFEGMLRGFSTDGWVPAMMINVMTPQRDRLRNRDSRRYGVMGRLAPGASREQAQSQLNVIAGQLHAAHPESWSDVRKQARQISVLPESEARLGPGVRVVALGIAALLMVVVQLVLFTACANVANLLLARAAARRREIAIRLPLGASRGRVIRQLLAESMLLALAGGVGAALLGLWVTDLARALPLPAQSGLNVDLRMDGSALWFTFLLSIATGVIFGMAPAWQSTRPDLMAALKEDKSGYGGAAGSRLRSAFVVVQVTLAVILLAGSGLFLRSLLHAADMDPGFALRQGVTLSMNLSLRGYDPARGTAFYEQLLERARSLPGVESATLTRWLPLDGSGGRRSLQIEGYSAKGDNDSDFYFSVIGPDYFRTLGIPVLRGREFARTDNANGPRVVVVNETFARRFWPGEEPLGKRVRVAEDEPYMQVIGVVADGKYNTLGEEPLPWFATPVMQTYQADMMLVLASRGPEKPLLEAAVREVQALDKTLPVGAGTMAQHMSFMLLPARAGAAVLGSLGALGLALAAVGLGGMMAYTVAQRTREIGVRMALGATRTDVLAMIIRQAMKLTAIGGAIGLAIALGAAPLLRSLLYGVQPADPVTFMGVALVLAAVAAGATYFPAMRATRVDPLVALRYE